MSMLAVPSLRGGAHTLPAELHSRPGDGWHRLYSNLAPLTEGPSYGVGGLGLCVDGQDLDTGAPCTDTTAWTNQPTVTISPITIPDNSASIDAQTAAALAQFAAANPQSPITATIQTSTGTSQQSMTPAQLTALINSSTAGLIKVLAVTQGGSVVGSNIYGSSGTATTAAANTTGSVNLTSSGLSALFSSPIAILGIGLLAFLVIKNK